MESRLGNRIRGRTTFSKVHGVRNAILRIQSRLLSGLGVVLESLRLACEADPIYIYLCAGNYMYVRTA